MTTKLYNQDDPYYEIHSAMDDCRDINIFKELVEKDREGYQQYNPKYQCNLEIIEYMIDTGKTLDLNFLSQASRYDHLLEMLCQRKIITVDTFADACSLYTDQKEIYAKYFDISKYDDIINDPMRNGSFYDPMDGFLKELEMIQSGEREWNPCCNEGCSKCITGQ